MKLSTPLGVCNLFVSFFLPSVLLSGPLVAGESIESYLELDLEDLLEVEVTSVSKKKQPLTEAAAAIFVITQDDIRRTGVTSIPEALRLAPGLQVAQLDSNKWAISSRGFNGQFANKLLVLMDGRSLYTPSFSGVYWDIQDTFIEDISRIEVIRGPGATLWGANAVNGVINIITKHASETQGGVLVAGGGNEEKGYSSLRYGGQLGESTYGRAYIKFHERDSSYAPLLDKAAGDDWQSMHSGFRVDGTLNSRDQWTLQGDIYQADENQIAQVILLDPADPANNPPYTKNDFADNIDSSGWHLLARWEHQVNDDSITSLQIYYDHSERTEEILGQSNDTLDIDFQHRLSPSVDHDVVWGLGYRRNRDEFDNTFAVTMLPEERSTNLYSAFVQDEIELSAKRLYLTLGSKFEHNSYTGLEIQPSARLLWLPREGHAIWTSVSRAVRTPSRLHDSATIAIRSIPLIPSPLVITLNGSEYFGSEDLLAAELGYRVQPLENLSFDIALFHNEYDSLATFEMNSLTTIIVDNNKKGKSHGLEVAVNWHPTEWWRLQANYSYLSTTEKINSGSTDVLSVGTVEGTTPKHQFSIRSSMDLNRDLSLDFWVRYVDKLSATSFADPPVIPAYSSVNARLAWRPKDNVELSIVGLNLLNDHHLEFAGENIVTLTEVERSIFAQVRWEF